LFKTLKNALKTPDVRKRLLYTLLLIVIFRLGCYITVPGVDIVALNKAMTWYGIEMKTLTDDTTSKLAELLMQGTNMGIIEGRRLLNHKHTDEKVNELVSEYVNMQENAVENLKHFL
jgi:hypothetical protein